MTSVSVGAWKDDLICRLAGGTTLPQRGGKTHATRTLVHLLLVRHLANSASPLEVEIDVEETLVLGQSVWCTSVS